MPNTNSIVSRQRKILRIFFFAFATVCFWYYNNVYEYEFVPSKLILANSTYNKNQVLRGDNNHHELLQLSLEDKLLRIPHKYYIYNLTNDLLPTPLGDASDRKKRYWLGGVLSIYNALLSHPTLRTFDPEEATFFIPPVFPNQVNPFDRIKSHERQKFMKALDVVLQSEIYQSTRGSRHIFLAMGGWFFNWNVPYGGVAFQLKYLDPEWMKNSLESRLWDNGEDGTRCYEIHHTKPWIEEHRECWPYTLIFKKAILAMDRDTWALRELHTNNQESTTVQDSNDEFLDIVGHHDPVPLYGFSLGTLTDQVPLVPATYAKYEESKYVYFYHGRKELYASNSTIYRHAPIERVPSNDREEATTYRNSSIGYDIAPEDWLDHFTHSKLCLVIRGDTPHSRALLRSIRVGCIPVVVSQMYPVYAPTLKSVLNFTEMTIMVDEQAFITNPWGELHRVYAQLTKELVQQKLNAISFAQRVIFPDHPKSLFVPAFLNEAWESIPETELAVGYNYYDSKKIITV